MSAAIDDTNIKVRDGALDIKELIERHDDLERWRPAGKYQFPLTSSTIEREVLPRLDIAKLGGSRDTYAVEPLIEEIVLPHGEWVVARVFKRRFAFTVVGCAAELDEVWINGAGLHSVAIESTNPSAVVDVRYRVGVDDLENVNYLQAIKRVTGMVPLRTPY